jgi:hypothetical protein
MDLWGKGWEGVDIIHCSGQGPAMDSYEHGNKPSGSLAIVLTDLEHRDLRF